MARIRFFLWFASKLFYEKIKIQTAYFTSELNSVEVSTLNSHPVDPGSILLRILKSFNFHSKIYLESPASPQIVVAPSIGLMSKIGQTRARQLVRKIIKVI